MRVLRFSTPSDSQLSLASTLKVGSLVAKHQPLPNRSLEAEEKLGLVKLKEKNPDRYKASTRYLCTLWIGVPV